MPYKIFPYIKDYGRFYWRRADGTMHNESGPAAEYSDGTLYWVIDGKLHRDDGPAILHPSGAEEYWNHGVFKHDDR